ncbi:MAG: VWA domain-containing protein [Fuerstiella sp.]|nr:VWA domain-containing protein [Fuerstiella sp.]MCP4509070.1 VWA domain-containing protein [Fuerstiella sp.]
MQNFIKNAPSIVVSLVVHIVVLVVLMLIPLAIQGSTPDILLESIFTEELPREQMEQQLELETKPAETLNVIAGGTPSTAVGAAAQPASTPVDVQKAKVLEEATVDAPRVETMQLSDEVMAAELGEGEITGEVGAMVEGYGAAMGIITQELIRMMRQQKVTVVWMFDESGSLEDDRKEIKENYMRVYDELGIATKQDKDLRRGSEQLLTVVGSYGKTIHEWTPKPTGDPELVKAAIEKVPIDESGEENMCRSIAAMINKYKAMAIRGKRKLAIIVVSDESGDDGDYVEEAVAAARAAKAPIYVMGRESMFGFPYARQRWTYEDKAKGIKEDFWIRIRRGPETAFPECLQWDGIHGRWDAQSAGFGPYEQVRMSRETGGIFFVLPGEEQNLVGRDANDKRKYDFLALREYTPLLMSRREYAGDRGTSEFRQTLWNVIVRLNPTPNKLLFDTHDASLNIRSEHYPLEPLPFKEEAGRQVQRAAKALLLVNEGLGLLENVKPMRAREASQRWRAGYDLAYAQLHMFRLRLYQFLLYMDSHANNMPKPANKNGISNEWNFWRNRKTLVPNDEQFLRLKTAFNLKMERSEYLTMVTEEEKKAVDLLDIVIKDHPGTPWARRAEREKSDGFGFVVADRLWDPKGVRRTIKLPNL